jgi:hypothetical protein
MLRQSPRGVVGQSNPQHDSPNNFQSPLRVFLKPGDYQEMGALGLESPTIPKLIQLEVKKEMLNSLCALFFALILFVMSTCFPRL